MSKKPKYSVDENNNLSIENNGQKLLARGRFSTDKDNRLIYWLNEPLGWRRKYQLGKVFVFEGKWRLNANHDLEMQLDKSELWQEDAVLALKGDIVSSDKDKLVFQIKSKGQGNESQIYFLKLDGLWQADNNNCINFVVQKRKGPADTLVFSGSWQVNPNHQVVYAYEKTNLKTKTKITRDLTFTGYWQIDNAKRLTYIFSSDSRSRFDFRAQIESPNLYPREGVIKYRLGMGARESRKSSAPRTVYLYGTWKFSRKLGLYFEMDYANGNIQRVLCTIQLNLNAKDSLTFSLANSHKEPVGVNITFSHKFLKKLDAEAFLRLQAWAGASKVETGLTIPF